MTIRPLHEIHRRRFGRNLGVGLALVSLVFIVFGLTVVKVTRDNPMQGPDHNPKAEQAAQAAVGGQASVPKGEAGAPQPAGHQPGTTDAAAPGAEAAQTAPQTAPEAAAQTAPAAVAP